MAKKRKKTRKELLKEPDEFLTISSKLINLAIEYKTYLTYALGIILVLAVIISGIRFFSIRAENKAAALPDKSLTKYNSIKAEKMPAEATTAMASRNASVLRQKDDIHEVMGRCSAARMPRPAFRRCDRLWRIALFARSGLV